MDIIVNINMFSVNTVITDISLDFLTQISSGFVGGVATKFPIRYS